MGPIIFAGTPEFARVAFSALLAAGHTISLVLTQPDRPAGRGLKLMPSAVKQAALAANIPVCQPRSLRLEGKYPDDARAARDALLATAPELIVVAAYGLILPRWLLLAPKYGCLNIHASLLPRWRGAAPIQRALEAGDAQTGVTVMQMNEGLDTGDIVLTRSLAIAPDWNAARLHDELAQLGARSIIQVIGDLEHGKLVAKPQAAQGVSYAAKLTKTEAALDLSQPATVLERRIRAFNPAPGATLRLPGLDEPVKVWAAQALGQAADKDAGKVQSVSPQGIDIATGDGVLRLLELQKPGGKRQAVAAFVRGWQAEF